MASPLTIESRSEAGYDVCPRLQIPRGVPKKGSSNKLNTTDVPRIVCVPTGSGRANTFCCQLTPSHKKVAMEAHRKGRSAHKSVTGHSFLTRSLAA